MSRIVPKLNLNKTPQLVESNSLIMAKNIRLLEDGTIGPDTSLDEVETRNNERQVYYISQIVGLNNKVYLFKEAIDVMYSNEAKTIIEEDYPDECFVDDELTRDRTPDFDVNSEGYVTRNGVLFEDREVATQLNSNIYNRIKIYEYDEVTGNQKKVKCGWKYNGGEIIGCVTTNNTGEDILTICEYNVPGDKLVPIKHINLSKCKASDDESVYTQAPNIPISNLICVGKYVKTIPSGVYQFFVRYKIRDDFYTTWMPCSKELFAGTIKVSNTLQGDIRHNDLIENSNTSFIFDLEHLYPQYNNLFEQYQLGFIISSESGVVARSWKHFDMNEDNNESIYFEYSQEDIEEINIDDLLKVNYDLFNVGNIAYFKNKLYIANYKETDFNENLGDYAKQINVKLKYKQLEESFSYYFNNQPLYESSINDIYDRFGSEGIIKNTFYNGYYCSINIGEKTIFNPIETTFYSKEALNTYLAETLQSPNGKPILKHVNIISNNTDHYIIQDDNIEFDIDNEVWLGVFVSRYVKNILLGIDNNGIYKGLFNSSVIDVRNFEITYKTFEIQNHVPNDDPDDPEHPYLWIVTTNLYKLKYNVSLKSGVLTTSSDIDKNEYNTLLPFTKYSFYIHYVKQNGIVTNGYYIGTKEIQRYCKGYIETQDTPDISEDIYIIQDINQIDDICFYTKEHPEYGLYNGQYYKLEESEYNDKAIIYPEFENIICPPGYVACFISISKNNNVVAELFNHNYDGLKAGFHRFDCLELDSLLYNEYKNIRVVNSKGEEITTEATYQSSTSTYNNGKYLGCSGCLIYELHDTKPDDNSRYWMVLQSTNQPYNKSLIKLTPYIKLGNNPVIYDNFEDVNSPGYFCKVTKLNAQYCDALEPNNQGDQNQDGYYVSANDIYTRRLNQNDTVTLEEVEEAVGYHSSEIAYIFSNFNLNYLSLTNDLVPIIRQYEAETSGEQSTPTYEQQFITMVDSLTASYILELKSMYKEYTRKTYSEYTKVKITDFNNTIRCSNINVDEIYRYIYRFEATDYYNVPCNRGIITNLVSIINNLYVHCEHSLFKFTDNRTLNSETEEVVLQENDIFNSGISELFDAQYGYAGLTDKKHSLVTYNAYIFYDSISKAIYAFQGEQQLANISDSIRKLIDELNPTDVSFVADEQHNRFFVNLINNGGNVCLSFNFAAKSFVSIHDIEFKFGFHTRSNTYFIHENKSSDTVIGWSIYRIKNYIGIVASGTPIRNYAAYQNCYKESLISVADSVNDNLNNLKCANSCVDVVINVEYEKIKVLNYLNWICSETQYYNTNSNFVAEEQSNQYPGHKIRIYTDSTYTNLIDLIDNNGNVLMSNVERNINLTTGDIQANPNSWQYIRHNCGVWSMNYFRDIKQLTTDLCDYKNPINKIIGNPGDSETTDLTPQTNRKFYTQESSLIYGKYFVVRFIFNNKNFKLENLKLNMNDYEKAK